MIQQDNIIDIDGNIYKTVKIGNQIWMAENLKVTHYRNGDQILNINNNSQWVENYALPEHYKSGAYCNYNNDINNVELYGRLYNDYAVIDKRGLAPKGWNIPTNEEIVELEMHLGMSQEEADRFGLESPRGTNEGSKLAGNADLWSNGNLKNNTEFGTSGFDFLPGGLRNFDDGNYHGMGDHGQFWARPNTWRVPYHAYGRGLRYDYSKIEFSDYKTDYGFSVRCIKD